MKELTIEQKAERYDEISKEVKDFFDGKQKMYSDVKQTLNHLFPELKESEDDRIRKDIIRVLKGEISFVSEKENEKYIAWLEKQGREEKIDNQNCVNPTNNSEPKFYEEDWITIDNPCQIISIDKSGNYIVLYCNDEFETHVLSKDFCESHYHLWTIQDAKAGDVLFGRYGIFIFMGKGNGYCGVLSDDTFINKTGNNEWTEELYPATKEQRDFLFKKMRKAGYEWDADKKEPKMIDWRKHTWTEKDEKIRKAIYNALKYLEWELSWDFLDDVDILDVYDWLEKQSNKV